MAFPNILVSTESNNTLVITNQEMVSVYIGIQIFDVNLSTPAFIDLVLEGIDWNSTIPEKEIEAADQDFTINIGLDGLYKLRLKDLSTDDVKDVYFILSSNIDACEKSKLQDLLCKAADDCKIDDCAQIAEDLKFYALKDTVTYFFKKLVDGQKVGASVPTLSLTNSEAIDISMALGTLSQICGCVNQVAGGDFYVDAECGCVKYNYTK